MITTGDHVLPTSKPLIGLRAAQLVTAIIILGLAAYGVTNYAFDGNSLILFTVCSLVVLQAHYD
jgi:ABC-type glycerol-3-phosphate transport system permease component